MTLLRAIQKWIANSIYRIYEYWLTPPEETNASESKMPEMRNENGEVPESGKVQMPESGETPTQP